MHTIDFVAQDRRQPLLVSVEGVDDQSWPESPPLQQLDPLKPAENRSAVLLVGMAGTSHWSLSAEAQASSGEIAFDVACRLHESPTWLGSRYRLAEGVSPIRDSSNQAIELELPSGSCWLSMDRLVSKGPLELCDRHLAARPEVRFPAELPATVRWRYTIRDRCHSR